MELYRKRKDGTVLADHLIQVGKTSGKWDPRLDVEVPPETLHLWGWFWALSAGRQSSGFGINPLSWTEMQAWAALTGNSPASWEWETLRAMDARYVEMMAETAKEKKADG